MPNDDILYVGHMLDTAEKALDKVHQRTRNDFDMMKTSGWPWPIFSRL
jgi:hypothetical protein